MILQHELHLTRQENKFVKQYVNQIDFFHCSYNLSAEPDIGECDNCGDAAFVHRPLRVLNSHDITCVDLIHQTKCFDKNVKCNNLTDLPYQQCEGLKGIPVRESEGISSDLPVKVLTVNITKFMKQTVLSQQIVALCPRCHFFGRPYHTAVGTCVQKLHTMRPGWPKQFQRCDWYQSSNSCIVK